MKKLFLWVYNDKSNVIQALEGNYFDSNCLYLKKLIFQKKMPRYDILNFFDLCLSIKYKIRLLKA